jgi:hypothetical protein
MAYMSSYQADVFWWEIAIMKAEYTILSGEMPEVSFQDFIKKVNEHIKNDWAPLGGISVVRTEYVQGTKHATVDTYYQAMIKKAPIKIS